MASFEGGGRGFWFWITAHNGASYLDEELDGVL